jgi:hypothetical protein
MLFIIFRKVNGFINISNEKKEFAVGKSKKTLESFRKITCHLLFDFSCVRTFFSYPINFSSFKNHVFSAL